MYVVIMGGGRVGLNLAAKLIDNGNDVTIIEKSEELCNNAAAELDALIICGNGTNKKTKKFKKLLVIFVASVYFFNYCFFDMLIPYKNILIDFCPGTGLA
jgi:predicted dinucleotide-binding enzyme